MAPPIAIHLNSPGRHLYVARRPTLKTFDAEVAANEPSYYRLYYLSWKRLLMGTNHKFMGIFNVSSNFLPVTELIDFV